MEFRGRQRQCGRKRVHPPHATSPLDEKGHCTFCRGVAGPRFRYTVAEFRGFCYPPGAHNPPDWLKAERKIRGR